MANSLEGLVTTGKHWLAFGCACVAFMATAQAQEVIFAPLSPSASVYASQTTLPPSPTQAELEKGLKDALASGNLRQATQNLENLNNWYNTDTTLTHYSATLLDILGSRYKEALTALDTMQKQNLGRNWEQNLTFLQGYVVLALVEQHQLDNEKQAADNYLRRYLDEFRNHPGQQRFARLARKQGWKVRPTVDNTEQLLKVGILLPLSGPLAGVGEDLLKGMQLALFDKAPENLIIYPEDTKGSAAGARAAAEKLLRLGANVLIGPLTAAAVDAVSPFADSARVPMLALSSDHAVAGPHTFLMSYLPQNQAKLVARHMVNAGHEVIAPLIPADAYGHNMLDAFSTEVVAMGASLTQPIMYDPNATDISNQLGDLLQLEQAQAKLDEELNALEKEYVLLGEAMADSSLTRLEELRNARPEPIVTFDAIFLPASAKNLQLLAAQLAFYDIDAVHMPLFGPTRWHDERLLRNRAEYLRTARFVHPPIAGLEAFERKFADTYGRKPAAISVLGYDALAVLAQILADTPLEHFSILDALQRDEGFHGLSGNWRWTESGKPQRQYDVLEIYSKGFKTAFKAPQVVPIPLPQPLFPPERPFLKRSLFDEWWR